MKSHYLMFFLSVGLLAGCTGSPAGPSAVVTGKVTLAGTPLTTGAVLFMTDDGQAATSELGSGGAYAVKCQPGHFKVAVMPPPPVDPLTVPAGASPPPANQPSIPKRYQDFGSSGLSFEVKAGENKFDIALTR